MIWKNAKKPDSLSFIRDKKRQIEYEEEIAKKEGRVLMKDGVWLVPIEERFEGWEKV